MINLADRVVIVTGAGAGLGREHALQFAARGAKVVANDVTDGTIDDLVSEIKTSGGEAVASIGSVADDDYAAQVVEDALTAFGGVDVVVNNAGIVRDSAFHKMSAEEFDAVMAVHLRGTVNVTKSCWSHFREQQYGRVVCTTSAVGLLGNFGQANYAVAKAGIVGLVKVLATEGRKYGITANAIAPVAQTQMTDGLLGNLTGHVSAELVPPVAVWLASEDCTETGQVYSVGGGRVARFYVGLTHGWARTDGQLTAEDVREHWEQINSTHGASEARALKDDFKALLNAIQDSSHVQL